MQKYVAENLSNEQHVYEIGIITNEQPLITMNGGNMKTRNLMSVYQGDFALDCLGVSNEIQTLKTHEIRNLNSFCDIMRENGCTISTLDGFYIGYTIKQIAKEFDLLRFGKDFVLNIEIKSELKVAHKIDKILKQMQRNYYYLKILNLKIMIFEYVDNDGFYQFQPETNSLKRIDPKELADILCSQIVDYSINPDELFIPSNYLISPFNSTDRFIHGDYFLTTQQERIKNEINEEISQKGMILFTLSANAGTGKTLLMYDIAKERINNHQKVTIIHCGKLNHGHERLKNVYNWSIIPIKAIPKDHSARQIASNYIRGCSLVFVDEAQRIHNNQLSIITNIAVSYGIPVIFSYDVKQYLKDGETLDLGDYLLHNFPQIPRSSKKLTNKIRTNKEMASFITNLVDIGKSKDHLDYSNVSVEYFDNSKDVKEYIDFLKGSKWTLITFTTSLKDADPYDALESFAERNAHDVIGQEFSKVAFVMDRNFRYSDTGKLEATRSYYSATGMLYQIVTRVVDELKIIVLNNPDLYYQLLRIKALGQVEK